MHLGCFCAFRFVFILLLQSNSWSPTSCECHVWNHECLEGKLERSICRLHHRLAVSLSWLDIFQIFCVIALVWWLKVLVWLVDSSVQLTRRNENVSDKSCSIPQICGSLQSVWFCCNCEHWQCWPSWHSKVHLGETEPKPEERPQRFETNLLRNLRHCFDYVIENWQCIAVLKKNGPRW